MIEYPLVSIISVNFKQTKITCDMLASLKVATYKNIEVILVDNGSKEDLYEVVIKHFPNTRIIISEDNLGFAGGNNLGIKVASGKYIMFLNNDTEVDPGFLEPMVEIMEKDPSVGMASPKIIYYDTDNIIQYAGSSGINPYTSRGSKIGHMEKDSSQYNLIEETSLVHGAAMMVPMEVISKVALMSELFFLYYEEHDWCEMIKRAGYRVFYIGKSKIYHKESISVGKESTLKTYYMTRNRLLFIRRNVFGFAFLLSMLFFFLVSVPNNTLKYILKFKFDHLIAFYKGIYWNMTHLNVHQNIYLK